MLRRAGAREVHVRIHSPQMRFPCYMGVDTGRRAELIAANHVARRDPPHDRRRLRSATSPRRGCWRRSGAGGRERRHCTACFNGRYPIDVPLDVDKFALERG